MKRRARVHSVWFVVMFLAPMLLLSVGAVIAQSQSGQTVDERAAFQINQCDILGGTATVESYRTAAGDLNYVSVDCKGGFLDGMHCVNERTYSWCVMDYVQPVQPDNVRPEGGVEVISQPPVASLAEIENADVLPTIAGNVSVVEAVVMPVPGGDVSAPSLDQVNGCRGMGGDAAVDSELDINGQPRRIVVLCIGGFVDGLWCMNQTWGTVCAQLPLQQTLSPSLAEPTADVDIQPTSSVQTPPIQRTSDSPPTPTVAATVTPAETATTAPTETPPTIPPEPTVESTMAPPPPPKNDNSVPPGGAEDLPVTEPTATDVVLN